MFEYGKSLLKQNLYYYRLKEVGRSQPKPALVLTAGLRPLDNLSSLFALNFIREVLAESEEATILVRTFDVYVFLELNPDGRLLGNTYRSACGVDLSLLASHSKTLHPELFFFYKAMREIDAKHKIALFIDFSDNWKSWDNQPRAFHLHAGGRRPAAVGPRAADILGGVLLELRVQELPLLLHESPLHVHKNLQPDLRVGPLLHLRGRRARKRVRALFRAGGLRKAGQGLCLRVRALLHQAPPPRELISRKSRRGTGTSSTWPTSAGS